jgi:hypothetical protein
MGTDPGGMLVPLKKLGTLDPTVLTLVHVHMPEVLLVEVEKVGGDPLVHVPITVPPVVPSARTRHVGLVGTRVV